MVRTIASIESWSTSRAAWEAPTPSMMSSSESGVPRFVMIESSPFMRMSACASNRGSAASPSAGASLKEKRCSESGSSSKKRRMTTLPVSAIDCGDTRVERRTGVEGQERVPSGSRKWWRQSGRQSGRLSRRESPQGAHLCERLPGGGDGGGVHLADHHLRGSRRSGRAAIANASGPVVRNAFGSAAPAHAANLAVAALAPAARATPPRRRAVRRNLRVLAELQVRRRLGGVAPVVARWVRGDHLGEDAALLKRHHHARGEGGARVVSAPAGHIGVGDLQSSMERGAIAAEVVKT